MQKSSLGGILLVLCAAVLWGSTGTAQSFASSHLSPYWVGALRLVTACIFFTCYLLLTYGRGRALIDSAAGLSWPSVLFAGACIASYNLAFFSGIKAVGISAGTAIAIGSGPVWAGLLQAVISRRRPSATWWVGTLLAVTGGSLMLAGGNQVLQLSPRGIVLCLLAGLSYASYASANKRLVTSGIPAVVTFWIFLAAALMSLPAAFVLSAEFSITPGEWAIVIYLGVVPTGIAYLLFSNGLRHISSASGVTLALMEPLTAFLLAILVANERPAVTAYLGLSILLAGLAVVIRTELKYGMTIQRTGARHGIETDAKSR
jgi:DME family drug/metabolite transporter